MRYECKVSLRDDLVVIGASRLAAFGGIKQKSCPKGTPRTHIFSLISHIFYKKSSIFYKKIVAAGDT